ncbi:MAG: hypothetical protein OJF51_002784 [Nitrospira sp.]|jgi:hypothetical protein|nr:MAG: hypothetical protein OJF51_002784 [Nitrospira sp.]
MNNMIAALVIGVILGVSFPAHAHTDEYFESVEAPHGGQLRMTGPFHMELVAKNGDLTVYVTDHADNAISVDGGLAKANIENGSTWTQVNMHPVGDNILRGSGTFSLTPNTVVVVFIKLPDQDGYAARFMPLKPKSEQGEKAPSHAHDAGPHHHHHPPKH